MWVSITHIPSTHPQSFPLLPPSHSGWMWPCLTFSFCYLLAKARIRKSLTSFGIPMKIPFYWSQNKTFVLPGGAYGNRQLWVLPLWGPAVEVRESHSGILFSQPSPQSASNQDLPASFPCSHSIPRPLPKCKRKLLTKPRREKKNDPTLALIFKKKTFIQQIFIDFFIFARYCARGWGHNRLQLFLKFTFSG